MVCRDIIQDTNDPSIFKIVGSKFLRVKDAFNDPYVSSRFNTYVVCQLDDLVNQWNINCITCKMYPFPMIKPYSDCSNLPDITEPQNSNNQWFLTPLRHTFENASAV